MKLSICIPTHHGRAETLRVLLQSIASQTGVDPAAVEICISDNASDDGTEALVAGFQRTSPFPVRYHRFPTDVRGVRNFINVVNMAGGEYCWMIGSDDLVLEGALEAVLQALAAHPVEAATVNKLNLDHTLQRFVGPDASIIVPRGPRTTRLVQGFENVAAEFGMLFTYMSTHVFRRRAWQAVIAEEGLERLLWTRHFPHTFVMLQIAKREGSWLWIGHYAVVQRLGNYALMEEKEQRESLYAMEVLEDCEKVWLSVLDRRSAAYRSLMRRHYLLYWNPFCLRRFLCESGMTPDEARALRRLAIRCFRGLAVFWLTGFPILCIPRRVLRATRPFTSVPTDAPASNRSGVLRRILRAIHLQNRWADEFDFAEALARRDIARRSAE